MITSETFTQQMINMMDVDFPIIGALYSFLIIIVGQLFLLNLILAVIFQAFITSHQKQLEEELLRMDGFQLSLDSDDSALSPKETIEASNDSNESLPEDAEIDDLEYEDAPYGGE
jgi:hypothetical protein